MKALLDGTRSTDVFSDARKTISDQLSIPKTYIDSRDWMERKRVSVKLKGDRIAIK